VHPFTGRLTRMLHFLLAAKDPETGDPLYADRNHLLAESRLLVCAGTDTLAATICGLLFYLVQYPRVPTKLTAEISRPITGCHAHQLIRLTGKHPLNAEENLSRLYDAGLITPNELHYVRNHGDVPRLLWEFHELDVENGKLTLSMDNLKNNFGPINIAVALACGGNRRKELNMVKKSKGFSWGSAAFSFAYWKGPLVRDVLLKAGLPKSMPEDIRYWVV
jgi:hypothetical protein